MRKKLYLYGDTETTGYWKGLDVENPDQPYIVEISGMLYDEDRNLLGKMHRIVKPDGWIIPKGASDVHGITQEIAEEKGVPMWKALWEYDRLLTRCDAVVFHNAQYDSVVIRSAHFRLNHMHRMHEKEIICTMREATPWCKIPKKGAAGYKFPNLQEAHQILVGRGFDGAHGSDPDTEACRNVHWAVQDLENAQAPLSPVEKARRTMVAFLKTYPWMGTAAGPLFSAALAAEQAKLTNHIQTPCPAS